MSNRISPRALRPSTTEGAMIQTINGEAAWSLGDEAAHMNRYGIRGLEPSLVEGQVITTVDGDVAWADPPAGGGGGGVKNITDMLSYAQELAGKLATAPVAAGKLAMPAGPVGDHGYAIKDGPATISAGWLSSDWFTPTPDSESAWVVVKGNLTIDAGQVFRPNRRKLFTVVYVTGDLLLNGEISMTARGANHSDDGWGTFLAPVDLAVKSGVTIAALGGAGGAGRRHDGIAGLAGSTSATSTGGGGSGGTTWSLSYGGPTAGSGAGAQGTCFCGGGGGAGSRGGGTIAAGTAYPNGGCGGATSGDYSGGGWPGSGAGNPTPGLQETNPYNGGANSSNTSGSREGMGGTLVVIVGGTVSGTGTLTSRGSRGGDDRNNQNGAGGGSGGGCIVQVTNSGTTATMSVTGGAGGTTTYRGANGGAGGAGSARVVSLT